MRHAWERLEMPTHFDGKHEERPSLGRPSCICEDIIKSGLK